ncbi:MAG: YbhB/YbcL family Raf kinase inhibitor-like protein [Candidatus Tyrphobacter sp.]
MVAALLLALQLHSATFSPGLKMPSWTAHGDTRCPGANRSPELHWSLAPAATRSYALILFDPDAHGGWYHWVAYDIPRSVRQLRAGAPLPQRELGLTSFEQRGYGGPCPPPGPPHHYTFTLYALDVATLRAQTPLSGPQVLERIRGHVLASAQLVGLYSVRH